MVILTPPPHPNTIRVKCYLSGGGAAVGGEEGEGGTDPPPGPGTAAGREKEYIYRYSAYQ